MAPHWKCGSGQPVAGSNPALSAKSRVRCVAEPRRNPRVARILVPRAHATSETLHRPSSARFARPAFSNRPNWPRIAPTMGADAFQPAERVTYARRAKMWALPELDDEPRPARERPVNRSLLSFRGRARRGTSGALNLQSAPAGLNSHPRSPYSNATVSSDVEDRVPRSGDSRTVSDPEGSSTKRSSSGAAERPGPSRSFRRARDRGGRRWVHGISSLPTPGS